MTIRSVVRLDDSRFPNADIYNVRLKNEVENGFVGKLGEIEKKNRDVRALETPVAGDSLVLIANPAIVYDNGRLGSGVETNYFMEADEVVTAYAPKATFVFGVSEAGISGTAVEDGYVVAGAGNKLVAAAVAPEAGTTGFIGKVVRFDQIGGALSLNVEQKPTRYVVIDTIQN